MNTNTTTIGTLLARATVTAAATGIAAPALASPAHAGTYDKYIAVDCPRPFSQECNAGGGMTVDDDGDIYIMFVPDPNSCADIIGHINVNGMEYASQQTGPGQGNIEVHINGSDIPKWPDETYNVNVSARGLLGGCNTGEMSGWAGHLYVQTGSDA